MSVDINLTKEYRLLIKVLATKAPQRGTQCGDDLFAQPVEVNFPAPRVLGRQDYIDTGQRVLVVNLIRICAAFQFDQKALAFGGLYDLLGDALALDEDAFIGEAVDVDAEMVQRKAIHRACGLLQQSSNL